MVVSLGVLVRQTVQQVRDYLDWHIGIGLGDCELELDRRGLDLRQQKILLSPPPDGETCSPDRKTVYLSGRLKEST